VNSPVDPSNVPSAQAWDGAEGRFWAEHADRFDRGVPLHRSVLISGATIEDGHRVVDIGCGTGLTTRDAARATPRGSALGIDLSGAMLALARRRATSDGVENATFVQGDAQVYPFESAVYDAVISRCGTMFFADREAAFRNIARALKADGRLAMVVWRGPEHNEWFVALRTAVVAGRDVVLPPVGAPGPFALADPTATAALLTSCGFVDVEADPVDAPMWFGTDPGDARPFVLGILGSTLADLDVDTRRRALNELDESLRAHQAGDGVTYASGAWLVRARRASKV
jgi:SAM-dependent methyltransferase